MLWTGPLIGSHLPGRDLIAWTSKHHLKTLLSHFHNPLGSIPTPCYMLGSFCTDQLWILQIHCHLSLHCIGIIWRNSREKLPILCTTWATTESITKRFTLMPLLFNLLHRLFFPMSQFWPQMHFDFSHFIWFTSQSPQSSLISHSVHGSTTVDDFDRY